MKRERAKTAPRKEPTQERSRALVDAILDAAVRVFTANPADAFEVREAAKQSSVNRIAEVAGVSIGSLYQYFPGRDAIVAALVRRRMRVTHERLLELLETSVGLTLEETASRLVDAVFEMKEAHAAFDKAIFREALRHALTAEAFQFDAELERRFADALESFKPAVRDDLPADVAAHLLFQGLRAVMIVGAIGRPDLIADVRMKTEMGRLIVSYLRAD
jgi:AcrR family transcriptional regulator